MITVFHFLLCAEEATGRYNPAFLRYFTSSLCSTGRVGVAWFFILSGSVLRKRYAAGVNPRLFWRKRVLRLYVPLWIAYAFFYVACYPANPWMRGVPWYSVLSSLLGMDFYYYYFTGAWDLILVGEWFTSVIVTLYLLFPLLNALMSRHRRWTTAGMLILFAANLRLEILTTKGGSWSLVNGLVYFWLGMLFETYRENLTGRRLFPWASLVLAGIVLFRFRWGIFGFDYLSTFLFSVFSYAAAYGFSFIAKPAAPAVRYLSSLSYEIYLVHHRVYFLLVPVFLNENSGALAVFFLFVSTTAVILLLSEKLAFFSARFRGSGPAKAERNLPGTKEPCR